LTLPTSTHGCAGLPKPKGDDVTKQKDASPDWVRITLRMTPEQRDLLRRAAEASGMTLSAYVLNGAYQVAEQVLRDQAPAAPPKEVESLPTFTKPARQRWESIPAHIRQRLLTNVWCGHCGHEVTMTDFSGTIKGQDLLLIGRCANCRGEVARVIEGA
jgi:hypothetical protein